MRTRRTVAAGLLAAACLTPALLPSSPAQDPGGLGAEVNRRIGQWQTTPQLAPFTQGLPAPTAGSVPGTAPSPGSPRQKIAFCYGVNELDPAWYGAPNELGGPENDARSMAAALGGLGFQTAVRLTRQATADQLLADLRAAAGRLQAGDVLVITYAGHGSTAPDENGDEAPNTEDQTWCLYNRMVIDDELGVEWTRFQAEVRIYVVADSCHSGTSIRALSRGQNPNARSKGAAALSLRNATPQFKVRTLTPGDHAEAVRRQRAAYLPIWRDTPGNDKTNQTIRASVVLLAACDDRETAGDDGEHGVFTRALLDVARGGQFTGTYRELISQISQRVNDPNQHPKLYQVGALTDENSRPFAP